MLAGFVPFTFPPLLVMVPGWKSLTLAVSAAKDGRKDAQMHAEKGHIVAENEGICVVDRMRWETFTTLNIIPKENLHKRKV
jgi:hypothetical protein